MTGPKIRPATARDINAIYGEDRPGASMRAIVADLDGKIIGIAGISYHNGQMTAFSLMDDAMKSYPVSIMKVGKKMVDLIKRHGRNVRAIAACDIEGSDRFLERLGFKYIGVISDGRVYQWPI